MSKAVGRTIIGMSGYSRTIVARFAEIVAKFEKIGLGMSNFELGTWIWRLSANAIGGFDADILQLNESENADDATQQQVEHIVQLLNSCKLSNIARPIQLFAVTSHFLQISRSSTGSNSTSTTAHILMDLCMRYIHAHPNYSGNFASSMFVVRNFNNTAKKLKLSLADLLHSLANSLDNEFVQATLSSRPEYALENLLNINVTNGTIANDLIRMLHHTFMNHAQLFYESVPAMHKLKQGNIGLDDDEMEEVQFNLEHRYKSLLQQEMHRHSNQMMDAASIVFQSDYLIALAKHCSRDNLENLADFLSLLANENTALLQNLSWKSKMVEKLLEYNRFTNNNMVALFSGIISADLMAVDDVEFHKNHQMYTRIVQILNRRLTVFYSGRYDTSGEFSNLSALHYCVTLYNMLYVRYCRKPFCDPSEFLIPVSSNNTLSTSSTTTEQIMLALTPQAIPFRDRYTKFTHYLSTLAGSNSNEQQSDLQMLLQQHNSTSYTIRRAHLVEDAIEQLYPLRQELRGNVKISLVNQLGVPERGIDGGGLFREFLHDLMVEMFLHGNYFQLLEHSQQLWWNTELATAVANDAEMLEHYEFMGMMLAKAVHCGMLINTQFCDALLNTALLHQNNTLSDLRNMDEDFYRNLQSLRDLDGVKLQALGLTFVSMDGTVPLLPNGQNTLVTTENVVLYIHLMAHWKLNVQCRAQAKAFQHGFTQVIPIDNSNNILRLFSPQELQKLIGGDDTVSGIDVVGLKQHMVYAGGYHPSQPIMKWFWEVLEEMTPQQQRQFLKFMTSCSRQPLLGFGHLEPKPCIQQIRVRDEEINVNATTENDSASNNVKLPTSSTCMNLLKLPCYGSKELLRKKLLYAIESGVGFELS
eukprot:CAMPEP_0196810088 /NCGR_PEP_ID=MMETSP1362-20130617/9924_1 /TAXON_ID=163516 /ORGANISM="Leptocylindrus danicus, Strain CCMP1856" /LENGTH=868 /DNA_ID=CAMNT_0042184955 /DNA_START=356 /DNA_END=2963 /DNA_ORIENTATION=+